MKTISHDLGELAEARILPLADLHLGDSNSDYQRVQAWIREIRENENTFAILNGDLMDTAIVNSLGSPYDAAISPMEQIRECVKIFEPIKDKLLAVLPGNHERRVLRSTSLDMTEIMCSQLGIADRYAPASVLLFVRLGKDRAKGHHMRRVLYTIYCVHGSGGGRMEGGKINRLMQLASICDADIYVHSHTHLPAVVKTGYFRVCSCNNSVEKVDKLFVNTAAALNWGGYGELQSYKPTSVETPVIILGGSRRDMKAILSQTEFPPCSV